MGKTLNRAESRVCYLCEDRASQNEDEQTSTGRIDPSLGEVKWKETLFFPFSLSRNVCAVEFREVTVERNISPFSELYYIYIRFI